MKIILSIFVVIFICLGLYMVTTLNNIRNQPTGYEIEVQLWTDYGSYTSKFIIQAETYPDALRILTDSIRNDTFIRRITP